MRILIFVTALPFLRYWGRQYRYGTRHLRKRPGRFSGSTQSPDYASSPSTQNSPSSMNQSSALQLSASQKRRSSSP
jgi:hypothetical protein